MHWSRGNPDVGSGSQKIVASRPHSLVRTEMVFGKQGTAGAEFRLRPQNGGTQVTWQFRTSMGPGSVARWMGLPVKRTVGDSCQQGLEKLKKVAESTEQASNNNH